MIRASLNAAGTASIHSGNSDNNCGICDSISTESSLSSICPIYEEHGAYILCDPCMRNIRREDPEKPKCPLCKAYFDRNGNGVRDNPEYLALRGRIDSEAANYMHNGGTDLESFLETAGLNLTDIPSTLHVISGHSDISVNNSSEAAAVSLHIARSSGVYSPQGYSDNRQLFSRSNNASRASLATNSSRRSTVTIISSRLPLGRIEETGKPVLLRQRNNNDNKGRKLSIAEKAALYMMT